jgi:hypothetical protein
VKLPKSAAQIFPNKRKTELMDEQQPEEWENIVINSTQLSANAAREVVEKKDSRMTLKI